jgi:hypothetical protein
LKCCIEGRDPKIRPSGRNSVWNHSNIMGSFGPSKARVSCHYASFPKGFDMKDISKPKIRRRGYPGFSNSGKRRDTFYALSIVIEHAPLNRPDLNDSRRNR